jgi:phenylacetate-coenzyme A ligase PaaK-like adenylate-forming protein
MRRQPCYWDRDFETRPWAWIEAWQAQQLAAMLETLPQRSEFYRDRLDGAGRRVGLRGYWVTRGGRLPTLDMLEPLPFTTRAELCGAQAQPPPGRPLGPQQAVPQEYVVQVVASSGALYGLTSHDQETWSDVIANVFWTAGVRPADVVSLSVPACGWPCADGLRRLGATVAWLDGEAPQLEATAVVTDGEVRRPSGVRRTMGVPDVLAAMWSECDAADGIHFNAAKHVIVELVDPETGARVPWSEGARGEPVYTTFDRDATPVLRYRSADLMEVTALRCPCGRTSPKVAPC